MGLDYQSNRLKCRRRSVGIWLEVDAPVEVVLEGVLVVVLEGTLEVVHEGVLRRLRCFHHGNLSRGPFQCLQRVLDTV